MSEPTPGTIRDDGLLVRVAKRCPQCGAIFWDLRTSKRRVCRLCRNGRRND